MNARGPDALRIGDVAYRINSPVGHAAQAAIGRDPARSGPHLAGRQIERRNIGLPPDRDQQVTARDPPSIGEDQGWSRFDRSHRGPFQHGHATRRQSVAQPGHKFRVFLAGDRRCLDHA